MASKYVISLSYQCCILIWAQAVLAGRRSARTRAACGMKKQKIYPITITISPLYSNYDYPHYIPIRYPLCLSISTSAFSSPSTLRLQGLGTGGCLTCSWSLRIPSGFAESGAGYTPGKHCNLNWENYHLSHGTFGYPILRQPPTFVPILKLLKHLSEGLFFVPPVPGKESQRFFDFDRSQFWYLLRRPKNGCFSLQLQSISQQHMCH